MSVDSQADRHQFNWLLGNFVHQTDGVRDAVAVSSDGLLIAASDGLDRADADHLSAIVSSLASVARSAARRYDFDGLKLIMIEMHRGFLLVSVMSGGSCLGVVAGKGCDIGLIGYQTTLLVERAATVLTPSLVAELKQEMLVS